MQSNIALSARGKEMHARQRCYAWLRDGLQQSHAWRLGDAGPAGTGPNRRRAEALVSGTWERSASPTRWCMLLPCLSPLVLHGQYVLQYGGGNRLSMGCLFTTGAEFAGILFACNSQYAVGVHGCCWRLKNPFLDRLRQTADARRLQVATLWRYSAARRASERFVKSSRGSTWSSIDSRSFRRRLSMASFVHRSGHPLQPLLVNVM